MWEYAGAIAIMVVIAIILGRIIAFGAEDEP